MPGIQFVPQNSTWKQYHQSKVSKNCTNFEEIFQESGRTCQTRLWRETDLLPYHLDQPVKVQNLPLPVGKMNVKMGKGRRRENKDNDNYHICCIFGQSQI